MHLHAGKIPSGKHTDLKRKEHSDVFFSLFIVAKKRLYVRVCPSVRRVVRRSVGNQLIFFSLLGALYTAFFFFFFFRLASDTVLCPTPGTFPNVPDFPQSQLVRPWQRR